ncbi:hypothetical protein MRF4_20070 [Methylobacterium radiotolerans]
MRERDRVRGAASPREARPRLRGDGARDPETSGPSPQPSPARERGRVACAAKDEPRASPLTAASGTAPRDRRP